MIDDHGSWSLGVLIGGPVAILLVLLALGGAVAMLVWARHEPGSDHGFLVGCGWGAIGLAFVIIGISAKLLYPFDAEYHQWREVSGIVETVDSRLLPSGEAMQEKFVVRFEGARQEFGVEDTRAALLEPGDQLTISCKRAWQYAGTDGYDCRWVGSEETS